MRVSSAHFRPTEVDALKGDASRIRSELNWRPETTFTVRSAPSTNSSTTNFSGGTVVIAVTTPTAVEGGDIANGGFTLPTIVPCSGGLCVFRFLSVCCLIAVSH